MYLYFDKLGVLKTIIPHGEIPRQGSTLNLYVCFDEDFFETEEEQNKHNVNVDLILPNNEIGTKNMLPQDGWPKLKMFMPVSSSEVTYDFVPGVEYLTYHFSFTPEEATALAGKVIANISVVEIIEKENGKLEDDTIYFGRAEIFVEKTFGNAKLTVNEASLHYKNLTKQINKLKNDFQPKLISGTNIKTLNGYSLLGEGDLAITINGIINSNYLPLTGGSINGDLTIEKELYVKGDASFNQIETSYINFTEHVLKCDNDSFSLPRGKSGNILLENQLKTLNGQPLFGSGNIEITIKNEDVDNSLYVVDSNGNIIMKVDDSGLNAYNVSKNGKELATIEYVDNKFNQLKAIIDAINGE